MEHTDPQLQRRSQPVPTCTNHCQGVPTTHRALFEHSKDHLCGFRSWPASPELAHEPRHYYRLYLDDDHEMPRSAG
jgi:hypothetical protein